MSINWKYATLLHSTDDVIYQMLDKIKQPSHGNDSHSSQHTDQRPAQTVFQPNIQVSYAADHFPKILTIERVFELKA